MSNCVRCDRFELPEHFIPYRQTPVFTEQSVPARLQQDHSTKAGVWAKILVTEGKLRCHVDALDMDIELSQNRPGIVVPEFYIAWSLWDLFVSSWSFTGHRI